MLNMSSKARVPLVLAICRTLARAAFEAAKKPARFMIRSRRVVARHPGG